MAKKTEQVNNAKDEIYQVCNELCPRQIDFFDIAWERKNSLISSSQYLLEENDTFGKGFSVGSAGIILIDLVVAIVAGIIVEYGKRRIDRLIEKRKWMNLARKNQINNITEKELSIIIEKSINAGMQIAIKLNK